MTNYLRVDAANSRLVMDKAFAKNAAIAGSREYKILQDARRDYEGFTVVTRQIKRNPRKECYKGLTYTFMEDYIISHEPDETLEEVLEWFEEMKLISKCHSPAFRYPTIKKRFLERYPEVKYFGKRPVENDEPKIVNFNRKLEEIENDKAVEQEDSQPLLYIL